MTPSKRPLYAVMILFILPLLAGTLLYYCHDYFHFKTLNHGMLITPPIQAQYLYSNKEKKWRVIHVSGNQCDTQCKEIDYQLQQVQKALGKNQNRIQLFSIDDHYLPLKNLQKSFETQVNKKWIVANKVYLIDPLGNLFMSYPETTDPMNILKDLKKVLEVSQIG